MNKLQVKAAEKSLGQADKIMKQIIHDTDPITLGKQAPSYFHALIQTIISQQLSIKAAETIEKRLLSKQAGHIFNAKKIHQLNDEQIHKCGLSRNKTRYIKTLAEASITGNLNFKKIVKLDDDAVRDNLIAYPGIGQWSVDIFLINGLQREDIFPVGDLIIRKSIQNHYTISDSGNHDEYNKIAESWRPYRTVASFYLWKSYHQQK